MQTFLLVGQLPSKCDRAVHVYKHITSIASSIAAVVFVIVEQGLGAVAGEVLGIHQKFYVC